MMRGTRVKRSSCFPERLNHVRCFQGCKESRRRGMRKDQERGVLSLSGINQSNL